MSLLDNLFKKKKNDRILEMPKLEPSKLESQIPSFEPSMEHEAPPKPEEFGVKRELPPNIRPHKEERKVEEKPDEMPQAVGKPETEKPAEEISKPEMPEFITPPHEEEAPGPLPHTGRHEVTKPVFVLVDDYKKALTFIAEIKQTLRQFDDIFAEMGRLKNDEDISYGSLYNSLEDVQRKLLFVDKSLFEKAIR